MASTGRLFINGREVGGVVVKSRADSWGFGEFAPHAAFAPFTAVFGKWSLLMHADDDQAKLSEAASEELRQAECEIDTLRAKLFVEDRDEWLELCQVNIDGNLIEWKVMSRRD